MSVVSASPYAGQKASQRNPRGAKVPMERLQDPGVDRLGAVAGGPQAAEVQQRDLLGLDPAHALLVGEIRRLGVGRAIAARSPGAS